MIQKSCSLLKNPKDLTIHKWPLRKPTEKTRHPEKIKTVPIEALENPITNLNTKTLHPRNEDTGREEPPHGLPAIDGELPTVQILVDLPWVRDPQRHSFDRVPAAAVVPAAAAATESPAAVVHRRFRSTRAGSKAANPSFLRSIGGVSLFLNYHSSFASSLSRKHIVQ